MKTPPIPIRSRPGLTFRPGFTLIEVLIAVSVISILVGILFIAFKSVGNSAKAKQTAATLEVLKTMYAEFEQNFKPPTSTNPIPMIQMLPAPTNITADGEDRLNTTRNAIVYTHYIMYQLQRVPAVRSKLESMSASQLMKWEDLPAQVTAPTSPYRLGDRLEVPGGFYVCIADTTVVPPSAGWIIESTIRGTPVPLDGWGNPILFVPSRGLRNAKLAAESVTTTGWSGPGFNYNAGDRVGVIVEGLNQNFQCVSTHISGANDGPPNPQYWAASVSSSNNRPFWVSTGPDGVVGFVDDKTDGAADNVYSFEN